MRERGFDAAHALLVRPTVLGDVQIVAGHHRAAAVRAAGLKAVPCWVREMDDDAAFMALVLANSQSELLPLERGLHALAATERGSKTGKSVSAYAVAVGRPERSVSKEVAAARVASSSPISANCSDKAHHLAELHATASWLWPALVERLLVEGWNVDTARGHAGRLKDAPEPPIWADRDALAQDIVAGRARANDADRMAKVVADGLSRIERLDFRSGEFRDRLAEQLSAGRPTSLSEVQAIVSLAVNEQADAKRQHEHELAAGPGAFLRAGVCPAADCPGKARDARYRGPFPD
jgi:ParB-like chromosome segregation protein Spo0J